MPPTTMIPETTTTTNLMALGHPAIVESVHLHRACGESTATRLLLPCVVAAITTHLLLLPCVVVVIRAAGARDYCHRLVPRIMRCNRLPSKWGEVVAVLTLMPSRFLHQLHAVVTAAEEAVLVAHGRKQCVDLEFHHQTLLLRRPPQLAEFTVAARVVALLMIAVHPRQVMHCLPFIQRRAVAITHPLLVIHVLLVDSSATSKSMH